MFRLDAHAVIHYTDAQQVFLPQRVDPDAHHTALLFGADAVLESIFHDRLQNKGRHHGLGQIQQIGNAPLHAHTLAKADVVNGIVFIHDAHLAGKRHLFIVAHQTVA